MEPFPKRLVSLVTAAVGAVSFGMIQVLQRSFFPSFLLPCRRTSGAVIQSAVGGVKHLLSTWAWALGQLGRPTEKPHCGSGRGVRLCRSVPAHWVISSGLGTGPASSDAYRAFREVILIWPTPHSPSSSTIKASASFDFVIFITILHDPLTPEFGHVSSGPTWCPWPYPPRLIRFQ